MSAGTYIIKSDKLLAAGTSRKTVPGGFGQFPSRVRKNGYWRAMRSESRDVYPVLIDLARAENNFTLTASHRQIAADIGCGTKHVQRAIQNLVELGLLQVVENGRMERGRSVPTTFRLLFPTDHADDVVRRRHCPVVNAVHSRNCPEGSGQSRRFPVDSTDHPITERSAESSRAADAAASSAAPEKDPGNAEDPEQVKLLIAAGVAPKMARGLPARPLKYVQGMIDRLKSGDIGLGGLVTAMASGGWSGPRRPKWAKSVGLPWREAWEKRTAKERETALRQLLWAARSSTERMLIEDVLAGWKLPDTRLIDQICKLTPRGA
jgi:hypothetical protein